MNVTEDAIHVSVASCTKVIVAFPALPSVIEFAVMAAMATSLEVAVHLPVDCEAGYAITIFGSPANFSTFAGAVSDCLPLTITVEIIGLDEPNFAAGPCTAVTVILPGFSAVSELPLTEAIVGSDDVKVQAPVEFEVGAINDICSGVPSFISIVRSVKPPALTTGSTAKIVTFKYTIIERKPPLAACLAEIFVVPDFSAVTVSPFIEATEGSALVKVQVPVEVEVGRINSTFETLSIESVMSLNVPTTGLGAVIVNFMVADAVNQLFVGDCVARIETSPPSKRVTVFPETVATLKSRDEYDHEPSEGLVGGTKVRVL